MSDKHLRILNSVNGMLGILIGAVVIIAILLFVLMFKAESSDAPTVVPAFKHFHLCDDLDRRINEATEMLTEEEQRWLSENLPGLTGEIDNVIKVFPEIDDIYDDAGAYTQVSRAMQMESVDEDWTAVKAALMEIEQ